MISLPQIQMACDLCGDSVDVEIEMSYISNACDFYFDADEWMAEHGWRRIGVREIQCPEHDSEEAKG